MKLLLGQSTKDVDWGDVSLKDVPNTNLNPNPNPNPNTNP